MAKCVGVVYKWKPERESIINASFVVDDVRKGEQELKEKIENTIGIMLLDIASDFIRIKQSALCDQEFKFDCSQVQDAIVLRLKILFAEISSTIRTISSAELNSPTKHRYFINFSYSIIEKLQQLVQVTGRLCDIDQRIYLEEQRKLLISDESITIHALSMIWSAVLAILEDFCNCAPSVFNPGPPDGGDDFEPEYKFLDELEFSTTRLNVSKILITDLIIGSWIKFNRLVKLEDLKEASPFLCVCQMKLYQAILEGTRKAYKCEDERNHLMSDHLEVILDPESKPSFTTMSSRRPGVLPLQPCYATADKFHLAYFLIWHLYAIHSRIKSSEEQILLVNCSSVFQRSLVIVQDNFKAATAAPRMSPHQQERYKLLFHMVQVLGTFGPEALRETALAFLRDTPLQANVCKVQATPGG